jgi:WD40 repeat protein
MLPLVLMATFSAAPVPAPKPEPLPPGAIMRLGSARFRMPNLSQSIVTRDGTQLITVSAQTKTVKVWDLTAGTVVREMTFSSPINHRDGFAWSPDGKTYATMGRDAKSPQRDAGFITLHDAATGNSIRSIPIKFTQYATSSGLQYLPDGKRIFALLNKSYAVFDVETGNELASQPYHRDQYNGAGLSPDGKRVIVLDMYENVAQVWDWESGQPAKSIRLAPSFRPGTATFAPDNKTVAITAYGGGTILLCDSDDGKVIQEFRHPTRSRWYRSVVFSPNGTSLLTNDDGGVNFITGQGPPGVLEFDIKTGKLLKEWPAPIAVGELILTADRKTIVAQEHGFMSNSSGFPRWDALTSERTNADDPNVGVIVQGVRTGPGYILTLTHERGHHPRLWDAETGKFLRTFDHERCYRAVAFSADGKTVVTGAADDRIKVWDTVSGKLKMSLPGHGNMNGVTTVALTADGKKLVSFGLDFYLRVTDLSTGKAIREYAIRPEGIRFPENLIDDATKRNDNQSDRYDLFLTGSGLDPLGRYLSVSNLDTQFIYETTTGTLLHKLKGNRTILRPLTFSPEGNTAYLYVEGSPIRSVAPKGIQNPDMTHVYPLRAWDLKSGQQKWETLITSRQIGKQAISPDGKWLCVGHKSEDGTFSLLFHSSAGGEFAGRIDRIPSNIYDVTFTADGKRVVLAMSDQTALVYPVPALAPVTP